MVSKYTTCTVHIKQLRLWYISFILRNTYQLKQDSLWFNSVFFDSAIYFEVHTTKHGHINFWQNEMFHLVISSTEITLLI